MDPTQDPSDHDNDSQGRTASTSDDKLKTSGKTKKVRTIETPPKEPLDGDPYDLIKDDQGHIKLSENEARRRYCRDVYMPNSHATATHNAKGKHKHGLAAVFTQTNNLWNRGKDPITFGWTNILGGSAVQRAKVVEAIKEWELHGYFHLVEIESSSTERPDIIISFDPRPEQGSWSLVGTNAILAEAGEATMNLGWIDIRAKKITAAESAVILHEVRT